MFRRARPGPAKELTDAIDRIMPMLRFFRGGDGTMARFNGAGPTPTDALATVLAYDDIEGSPVRTAANSGYVRLECGTTLIICDLGPPPITSLTTKAHAGFLSFEMSSGDAPMIINCGAPSADHEEWRLYARTTPAHSTLSLEEDSLAEFNGMANGAQPPADATLSGPINPQGAFSDQGDNLRIKGSHDGYMGRYGVAHSRQILVQPSGNLISSEDKLTAPRGLQEPRRADRRRLRHPLSPAPEREGADHRRRQRRHPDPAQRRDLAHQLQRRGDGHRGKHAARRPARTAADLASGVERHDGRGARGPHRVEHRADRR